MAAAAAAWCARVALDGISNLLIVLGAGILVGGAAWVYAIQQTRRSFAGSTKFWDGMVEYQRSELEGAQFSTIRVNRALIRRLLGTDNAFGRMTIGPEGIRWRPNRWWSVGFAMAKGSFLIPWSDIAETTVENAAGKVSSLGGNIMIRLRHNNWLLSGEFLGSQDALREALTRGGAAPANPSARMNDR